jgi:tetratricopeptide (TPR) repeat protein
MGVGYGLTSWLFGPMLYNWGYSSYYNPYYSAGGYGRTAIVQPIVYNYAQPIDATTPPPEDTVTTQAMSAFDQAREAFRQGDYSRALDVTDQALRQVPNDPTLHEFRALVLYALGRYDEAAAALYAVLSVGPGWDWSTMIGLYANPDTYTQQLRALENDIAKNPRSAADRFVLAYQYLTMGHIPQATAELKDVVTLQPKDQVSAQLVQQLQQSQNSPDGAPPAQGAAPAPSPVSAPPGNPAEAPPSGPAGGAPPGGPAGGAPPAGPAPTGKEGKLEGTWTAQPSPETTITVTFPDPAHFVWKVSHQGQEHQFQGETSFANGILTLAQDQNNAMVGDVTWKDSGHFQFKVLGGGPSDPGLSFAKSS